MTDLIARLKRWLLGTPGTWPESDPTPAYDAWWFEQSNEGETL